MPRINFDTIAEMKEWAYFYIKGVKHSKYIGYHTDLDELILVPLTSTDPVMYSCVKGVAFPVAQDICTQLDIKCFDLSSFIWSSDSREKEMP